MEHSISISQFDYPLPAERIAKFPLERRDASKLLVYRDATIRESNFTNLTRFLPQGALLVFNNTKVVRARLIFAKQSGARIEIFCLEPALPADYERAFAQTGSCQWHCIVGNSKKWKDGHITIKTSECELRARRQEGDIVQFEWDTTHTFGQLLELLGRIPIPPYLCRDSQSIDNERYQTTYSRFEGSVAAPTAGLHFSHDMLHEIESAGFSRAELTLHVGAGTFLPVKSEDAREHTMHLEHFDIQLDELAKIARHEGRIIAVGTTSVRTLESLAVLGERVLLYSDPRSDTPIGQWEAYDDQRTALREPLCALYEWMLRNNISKLSCATQIMIVPGYWFRTVAGIVTNFHQPKSTLLLLISALVGGERWREIYTYALDHDFRFLSYGDSSLLFHHDG